MGRVSADELWDIVHEKIGEDLRGVTRYKATEYDVVLRDDVRDLYGPEGDRRVVDDAIISQLSSRDADSSYKAGDLNGLVKIFDDAWILTYPDSIAGKSGYIVSVQRRGGTTPMDTIEWCIDFLADQESALAG